MSTSTIRTGVVALLAGATLALAGCGASGGISDPGAHQTARSDGGAGTTTSPVPDDTAGVGDGRSDRDHPASADPPADAGSAVDDGMFSWEPTDNGLPAEPGRVTYRTGDGGQLTLAWDGERQMMITGATKLIYSDAGNIMCDLEDRQCMKMPGGGGGPAVALSWVTQFGKLGPLLADRGERLDARTIAGIDATCVRVDLADFAKELDAAATAATAGTGTWCVDPESGLILEWAFTAADKADAELSNTMTAIAVGEQRADDFTPTGKVLDPARS